MPRLHIDGNPNLVSPGVKWGVQPGGFTHTTELFGPVLGVMEARDLDDAIALVNATGYGLTSGLESLDDREQEMWRGRIKAGNLYVNRPTTGAIVLRQPFGGMGKSRVGPGIKAGGPNYVAALQRFAPEKGVRNLFRGKPGMKRFQTPFSGWAEKEFGAVHDHFRLLGEDNFRRYLPVEPLRIRVHEEDTEWEIFCRAAAARAVGCRATVSSPPTLGGTAAEAVQALDELTHAWAGAIEFIEEDDEALAAAIRTGQVARVRYASADRVPPGIRLAAAEALQYVADEPVVAHGRIELLWYVVEQSVSQIYHRYGNLGRRSDEPRDEPV